LCWRFQLTSTARSRKSPADARDGGTTGWWSCSWSSFRASVVAKSGCRSWAGCSARKTDHAPSSTRSARRSPGQQSRTPLKGPKLQSLAKIAKSAVFMAVTITGPDGRLRTAHIHEFTCLWDKPFHTRPVKVILDPQPRPDRGIRRGPCEHRHDRCQRGADRALRQPLDDRDLTKKRRPTAAATHATASRRPSAGRSRSGSSRRRSRSRGMPVTATRKPTSTTAAERHRGTAKRPPSATPACSPRSAANSSASHTRLTIRPTVSQSIRNSRLTVLLSETSSGRSTGTGASLT
jgi:hypothetical protein